MTQYKSFETERLIIQPTTEEDAPFILELMTSPKWIEFIGDRNLKTEDDARDYIRRKVYPQFERLGFGNYTVIRKSDHEKLGTCGFYDREGVEGVDIGFAFLPQYEKQGYAYECSNRIKEAGWNDFKLNSISAITIKENKASQKLLEKLGLKLIELIRIPNDDEELMLYRLDH